MHISNHHVVYFTFIQFSQLYLNKAREKRNLLLRVNQLAQIDFTSKCVTGEMSFQKLRLLNHYCPRWVQYQKRLVSRASHFPSNAACLLICRLQAHLSWGSLLPDTMQGWLVLQSQYCFICLKCTIHTRNHWCHLRTERTTPGLLEQAV